MTKHINKSPTQTTTEVYTSTPRVESSVSSTESPELDQKDFPEASSPLMWPITWSSPDAHASIGQHNEPMQTYEDDKRRTEKELLNNNPTNETPTITEIETSMTVQNQATFKSLNQTQREASNRGDGGGSDNDYNHSLSLYTTSHNDPDHADKVQLTQLMLTVIFIYDVYGAEATQHVNSIADLIVPDVPDPKHEVRILTNSIDTGSAESTDHVIGELNAKNTAVPFLQPDGYGALEVLNGELQEALNREQARIVPREICLSCLEIDRPCPCDEHQRRMRLDPNVRPFNDEFDYIDDWPKPCRI